MTNKKTKTRAAYSLTKEQALSMYELMCQVRRFEERTAQFYGSGKIGGFCHLYNGQEAVVCGFTEAMSSQDTVITTYRCHAHSIASGEDPARVYGELLGRADGVSRGKGGSMHMFSPECNFYGGHGIVGASVALGAGLAFAHAYREDNGVTLCYFGDGAANQGQYFEVMNMAKLWSLPILFIVENNKYAMGTSLERAKAGRSFADSGYPFEIKGTTLDGMNSIEIYEQGKAILEEVRATREPQIIEAMTYRYRGHSMSDPATYRTKEELDYFRKQKDPIKTLEAYLKETFSISEDELKEIVKKSNKMIDAKAKEADAMPFPALSTLTEDVLIED